MKNQTKTYVVTGLAFENDDIVEFTQICGSVTEICKFLKNTYDLSEDDSRVLIVNGFNDAYSKVTIPINLVRAVQISKHKVDAEVRLHGLNGCW
jgi:hypothetical protein